MIEFKGYLTGESAKRHYKKYCSLQRLSLIAGILVVFPGPIVLTISMGSFFLVKLLGCVVPLILIITYLPNSEKGRLKLLPKRITIEDGYMTSYNSVNMEQGRIEDVKLVIDCGEFYEIDFTFFKKKAGFICQKNLLTQGTIEEFESLFEGKIRRLHNTRPNSLR